MHPAFSVIFFTTLSGAGYGLLGWTAILALFERHAALYGVTPWLLLALLATATALFTTGLLSSLAHLGKPQRAWRSFSQWRTSWLSREGVAAVLTYVPVLGLAWILSGPWRLGDAALADGADLGTVGVYLGFAAIFGAGLTVACTAMIYASLKPVPAWRNGWVLPAYLVFSVYTGLLLFSTALHLSGGLAPRPLLALAALLALLLAVIKAMYWRRIDRTPHAATRASALGLPADRVATVFERPHTEANYLTREMGFVLARKHARKLRIIAVLLFALLPLLGCALAWSVPAAATAALAAATLCALLGAVVERWLFFAQARHVVMQYY